MTIGATTTYNPSIGTLFLLAHELCGVVNEHQSLTEAQIARCRRMMDMLVRYLQAEGVAARTREFVYVTLVSGQATYTLGETVLDVEGTGAFIPAGQPLSAAAGETVVQPMTMQAYQELSSKDATGRPFQMWANRNADQITVTLWPTPGATEDGANLRLVSHRLRADNVDTNATPDSEGYWNQYLTFMLGSYLARSYSLPEIASSLAIQAGPFLAKIRAAAAPQDTTDFVLGHSGGYT